MNFTYFKALLMLRLTQAKQKGSVWCEVSGSGVLT